MNIVVVLIQLTPIRPENAPDLASERRANTNMIVGQMNTAVAYMATIKHAHLIVLVKFVHLTGTVVAAKHAAIKTAAKNVPVLVLEELVQRMKIVQLASTVVARTKNARRIASRNLVLHINTARQASRAVGPSKNAWQIVSESTVRFIAVVEMGHLVVFLKKLVA